MNSLSLSVERLLSAELSAKRERALSAELVPSDNALIGAIQKGDHAAFGQLFDRYSGIVRAVVRRIVREPADVEDVVQDAFLNVYQKSGTFDPGKGAVHTWLCSIARYKAIRCWHQRRSRDWQAANVDDGEGLREAECGEFDPVRHVDFERCLETALASLSEAQRQTMILYFYEGLTLSEVAAQLSESLPNVRHHLYRGIERLRRELDRRRLLAGYVEYETCRRNDA